jgi:hypothetical protein
MTDTMGIIKAIVQGARKDKSRYFAHFELGNNLEIVLSRKDTAGLHKVIDSSVLSCGVGDNSYPQLLSLQICLETYYQLIITEEESEVFYNLLLSFIEYLPSVKSNHLLVNWRFLFRLSDCLGFPIVCINNDKYEFTDIEDVSRLYDNDFLEIIRHWLDILPLTGRYVSAENILNKSCFKMNKFIFDWFNTHLNKRLHHNALVLYEENLSLC